MSIPLSKDRAGADAERKAAVDSYRARRLIFSFGPCEGPTHFNNWIADERERLGTRYNGMIQSSDWLSFVFFGEFDPGSGQTLAECIRHASRTNLRVSGGRVSNTWVTCLVVGNNSPKGELIPHNTPGENPGGKSSGATRGARGRLASWWGNSLPRRRSVAGLRGWSATRGLRYGPDSYGRQQLRILRNGRKPDAAIPRGGRRPSGRKPLL